jgi:MinD-like ATPase involved in chromosome partitioning or flagellar assembly
MTTQTDVLRRILGGRAMPARMAEGADRIIAVGSGKGGSGASVVATLLAVGAAEHGTRTLLVDTDTDLGTLHRLLGVDRHAPIGTLLAQDVNPQDVVASVFPGLDLVAGGGAEAGLSDVERRAVLKRVAPLFDGYDLIVIDAGSRLDGVLRAIAAGAGRLLAVGTSEPIAVAATYALVKAVEARHDGLSVEVLFNRDDGPTARRAAEELTTATSRFLAREIGCVGLVPEDPSLRAALGAGMSLLDAAAGSPAAALICALGARLRDVPVPPVRTSLAARTA